MILILAFLLYTIKGIEEIQYISELNEFQTISQIQTFYVKTEIESIAYFDSIDKRCLVYDQDNKRIDGLFYKISPNKDYKISTSFYNSEKPSIFIRYLFPLDLSNQEINIKDNSISYLYLIKNKIFTLNFESNSFKRMITLSQKTLDSKIIINKNNEKFELNKDNLYYTIEKDFKGKLTLETNENFAFIQFLIGLEENKNYEKLSQTSYINHEIKYKTTILVIPYTQKEIEIQLSSSDPFKFSFSNGFSSNNDYYYNSISNINIDSSKNGNNYLSSIIFHNLYRNIILGNKGFFTFAINVDLDANKKIYLNYKQFSKIDDLLDEVVTQNFCQEVIKNFQDLFEIYVYTDIAKNPPEISGFPNYHEKIDIKERLNQISTTNRKYYEFYQDIQMVLAALKDRHLRVRATKTPNGIKINQYSASLPFNFIINEINSEYKIFIKKNDHFNKFNDKNIQNFINNHLNIPIKSINNIDPFTFIQNWSKFRGVKNKHADFTKKITEISHFNLFYHPLNYSDMSINEYEFEDNKIIRIPYHITVPIKNNLKFDNYFLNVMKNADNEIPRLDIIYKNFLNFKEKKIQNFNQVSITPVNWNADLSHIEGNKNIKCRVDDINKANVIYQNSFSFEYYEEVIGKILKCIELFYTNDYPIIIIESQNGGGYAIIYRILLQVLQPRIEFEDYFSFRITPISEEYFKKKIFYRNVDSYDCTEINDYLHFKKFYEDSYGDNSIHHNRTSPIDIIRVEYRLALKEFRKELLKKSKFIKRPTDIIVLTDSYSFSATSGLIKGFQNSGGAVTVGFFGNPKIQVSGLFDASQSISSVEVLSNTKIKSELNKNGFVISGVTVSESYDFHQINVKDQIPREYTLDPVDFRIDIYSDYSDDLYDKFIKEGLKIHQKLNIDNQCNKKNDRLFLHNDKCKYINGDLYTHGGYKCGKDNTWDTSKCEPYYCEIGYYFDQIQKKCIENCKYDKEIAFFIYEDNVDKIFDLKKNVKYNFIFPFYQKKNYFYSTTLNNIKIKKPVRSLGLVYNPTTYDNKLQIIEKATNLRLYNLNKQNRRFSIIKASDSLIFMDDSEEDYILYLDNTYKSSNTQFQLAEYNEEMTYDEILNHDSKYFKSYTDNIHTFSKGKLYLLYIKLSDLDPFNIFMNQIYEEKTIQIEGLETEFLYLEKNTIYTLDFQNNKINRMIKLSRETLKSEIHIEGTDVILDSKNLYYKIKDNYKGQLRLSVYEENALIEFLFKQDDSDIDLLNFDEEIFTLNKKYNILTIPKKYSSKIIDIELSRNEFLTNFTIYLAYAIPPYNYFSVDIEENIFTVEEIFTFRINEHYKGDFNLMENEYYCIMIENFGEDVTMSIEIKDEEKDEENNGLESWKIALIVVSSIIVFLLLVFLLYVTCRHCCTG